MISFLVMVNELVMQFLKALVKNYIGEGHMLMADNSYNSHTICERTRPI
jgi:hypothetical protein